jgi:spoIIIJ-associated protein
MPPAAPRAPRIADMDSDDEAPTAAATGAPAEVVSDEELQSMAIDMLGEMVRLMGFDAQINAIWHEPDQPDGERYLLLDIHGHDLSALIGRRGETLAGIQYLVRLMVNQRLKSWKNIVVDVDHYKERRVTQLTQLAHRMADQVAQSGRAVSLEPMPANERRIVHLALRDHESVYTQSSGEGERRKVHIVAKS